jgi:hypothetical protein
MRHTMAVEDLKGKGCSTLHNRLGLIFTCVNSMAGIRDDGNMGNVEIVKDAILKSDMFRNQREMLIKEWQCFIFYSPIKFHFSEASTKTNSFSIENGAE